jgi:hypothetical protein
MLIGCRKILIPYTLRTLDIRGILAMNRSTIPHFGERHLPNTGTLPPEDAGLRTLDFECLKGLPDGNITNS